MTEFQAKISELEFLHQRVQAERNQLESNLQQRKQFKKVFFDVKSK